MTHDEFIFMMEMVFKYAIIARENRPDWDAFLAEAKADPLEIAYEVQECSDVPLTEEQFDMLFTATKAWLEMLS